MNKIIKTSELHPVVSPGSPPGATGTVADVQVDVFGRRSEHRRERLVHVELGPIRLQREYNVGQVHVRNMMVKRKMDPVQEGLYFVIHARLLLETRVRALAKNVETDTQCGACRLCLIINFKELVVSIGVATALVWVYAEHQELPGPRAFVQALLVVGVTRAYLAQHFEEAIDFF